MSNYFNAAMVGIAYGDGELQGPGEPGQVVKLVSADTFEVVGDAADLPAGIIGRTDRLPNGPTPGPTDKAKTMVFMGDGIYESDNFTAPVTTGCDLSFDATTGGLKAAALGETIIGRLLAESEGVIKFLWTNHGNVK